LEERGDASRSLRDLNFLHDLHLPFEEALPNAAEESWRTRREEEGLASPRDLPIVLWMTLQVLHKLPRDDRGGVENGAATPHHALENPVEEFVVGTTEKEDIGIVGLERSQVLTKDAACFGFLAPAFLNERNEEGAGLLHNLDPGLQLHELPFVRMGRDRCPCADDSDATAPCPQDGFFRDGSNDTKDIPRSIRDRRGSTRNEGG
jgi:hypothetical protein